MTSVAGLLNRTVEVWRRAEQNDGAGGEQTVWTRVDTRQMRISQPTTAGRAERYAGPQNLGDLTHVVYDLPDADIRRGDQLRADGLILRVITTLHPSEPIYLRANCEQLQSEEG